MTSANRNGKVIVRRKFSATRQELFDEWTDPEGMRLWMCPGAILRAEVQMDLRVGGHLIIVMHGATEQVEHRGEFTVIDRPAKLAFTWIAKSTGLRPTLVTVEFFEITAAETELVLTHLEIPREDVRDQYQGGWSQIVGRLEQQVRMNKNKGPHVPGESRK